MALGMMTSYLERLVDFVGAHPLLSFLAVFLLALSEAVPVIGTVVPGSTLILAISALATTAGIMPWALLVAAGARSNCRRRLLVLARTSLPTADAQRLAAQSLSLADRAQRTIYPQIWDHERVPGALHSSCARLCPLAGRNTENVIPSILCGQYPVGTGVGADARVPWSVARPGRRVGYACTPT